MIRFFKRLFGRTDLTPDRGQLVDFFRRTYGYRFRNGALLEEALTHRSFIRINHNSIPSNERLEYLGDSVLGLLIAEYLYRTYPGYAEGDLTKTKSLFVNETTLAAIGQECDINRLIFLSEDEEKSGGRDRSSIISDAVEAIIGAIYLDGGLAAARDFIYRTIVRHADDVITDASQRNYKGELLEYLQAKGQGTPYYEVVSESGPDHAKVFEVAVYTDREMTGRGKGHTKKEAEQKAAAASLEYLHDQETGAKA